MKGFQAKIVAGLLLATAGAALAQEQIASPPPTVPVTADNFVRAETDVRFAAPIKRGAFGKFAHRRELAPVGEKGGLVRPNRDTLYSAAVFDLDAGPVTVTLPDAGRRFMSLSVINQDHYALETFYGAGSHTFTRDRIGSRYALMAVRTLIDPANPKDMEQAHALQDAIKVEQKNQGRFEVPNWDPEDLSLVRDALSVLGSTLPDLKRTFGRKDQVDPVRHLIGTAMAWGGNPEKDAMYLNVVPDGNDGATVYRLRVKNVPVDGFWSVSVYDAEGYFEPNPTNAYSVNNITAKKEGDGSVAVQFGGCDGKVANCLPIMPGWNYMVRLYRPRAEVLNGQWAFPEAQAAK